MTTKLTDPFSVTYDALATGQPSWSGGYKCITINGQPALQYLSTDEMSFGEYYNFMRGKGDFSAARIAQVLQDDKVIAGVRRRFFSSGAESPESRDRLKAAIESNVRAALKSLPQQQQGAVSLVASHIVGDPPIARSKAIGDAFRNIFETDEAITDITRIVDTAGQEECDVQEAKTLIEEVFSYALPDDTAVPAIDDQIERGIGVLLEKGVAVEEIFNLFKNGYPVNTQESSQLHRFIPLLLRSLSLVDYPLPLLKMVLEFLDQKAGSNTMAQAFIAEARTFITAALERNKKGNEDACLIALPVMTSVLSTWPVGEFTMGAQRLRTLGEKYHEVQSQKQYAGKESLPGLKTFATLVSTEPDLRTVYDLRPKALRKENEKLDFAAFFHHLLEAAQYAEPPADGPAAILEKSIPLLSEHLEGTGYESFVEDLKNLLPLMKEDLKLTREAILPLLEAIVPKKGQRPAITPETAQRMLADAILHSVQNAQHPATALLQCLPILQKQALGSSNAILFGDIRQTLKILQNSPSEPLVVQRLLIPLLDGVIPKQGAVKLEPALANATLADCIFLLTQGSDLSQLLLGNFEQDCQRLTSEAITRLLDARVLLLSSVQQQAARRGGASEEFACKAAFLFQIGSLLDFDEGIANVRFLPRIQEVFFGRGVAKVEELPSAPLSSSDQRRMETLLSALQKTSDTDYHETLQKAGVPSVIRGFRAT